ncbi:Uncharacterized protein Adt_27045 [Abeliophyllum distichum]|uniref:Uncharacterized protein n=1 Tax=Abeliophyllum distichum TaxID=126358 RepID=A0ABD1RSM0_9LAMI
MVLEEVDLVRDIGEAEMDQAGEEEVTKGCIEEKACQHCDYCNMNGHTRSACFKIHGYPDWYKNLKEQKAKISNQNGRAVVNMADTPLDLDEDRHDMKDKTISQSTNISDLIQ